VKTTISGLHELIGQKVTVHGWVHTIRNQKRMQFVVVRDHTGLAQAIHERQGETDTLAEQLDSVTRESAVVLTGQVVANPQVKLGQIELVINELDVVGPALAAIPLGDDATLDARLDWRFLDLRQPKNRLIFEVQTAAEEAMREFWHQNGFLEIHSPKLMGGASESGAELFRVEYFDRHAYLAQSPQFYKQMAMVAGFDRVFEIGPVFRANPSFTSRHDTEFTSVDVEISWIDSHEDVMKLEEDWLNHVLTQLQEQHGQAIRDSFGIEVVVPGLPFPRISMAEAYAVLDSMGHDLPRATKGDLDPEGERLLAKHIMQSHGHEFVFVTDYPVSVRPFYHMRHTDHPELTKSFDLIWKGIEVTTGAQREHRVDILTQQAKEKEIPLDSIGYYLDFFRYGCPPHGGYGFGLTRMLMILLGLQNVREATYLYRGPNRLTP